MFQEFSSVPRVAFVTGCVKLGGAATFLCNLGCELARRKIPVEVLSFERESPYAEDFQRGNVPVLCLDERRQIFEDRLAIVLHRLRVFQPTVVVATLISTSFEVLRYLPPGIFRVGMGQSDDFIVYDMMRHYAPHLDLLAVVSQTMQAKAAALPEFARTPISVLPYGVPMPGPGQTRQPNLSRPLRILYLGRLSHAQKRVHLFPQILEHLKTSGIPFHWTIAGEGAARHEIEPRMISPSPAQQVEFIGALAYSEIARVLETHDIFLLASDFEGLPLSLLEAMGHGLVPVVSDLASGIPEVVDATNGIRVPVNDVAGYVRAIVYLHEHRQELAAKSTAARARVQKEFSVEAMTDRWLAVFPQKPPSIGPWPTRWNIKAPLPARHPLYFSPPMRVLRRLAMKFRE